MARGSQDTHKEEDHKVNVGLNLKFNKKNEEVPGFTKKVENQWLYSKKALDAVSQYVKRYLKNFACFFVYFMHFSGGLLTNSHEMPYLVVLTHGRRCLLMDITLLKMAYYTFKGPGFELL